MPQRSPDRSATSPRARLHEHGVEALTEAELLALILRTGEAKASAHQVALRVLVGCGGLPGLARSSRPELARISGVGEAKSASLLAALQRQAAALVQVLSILGRGTECFAFVS